MFVPAVRLMVRIGLGPTSTVRMAGVLVMEPATFVMITA